MYPFDAETSGDEIEISGFSVVLLAASSVAPSAQRVLSSFEREFRIETAAIDTDPLPLGDRGAVLEALESTEHVIESGRAAAFECDGVTKLVTPEHGILVVEHVRAPYFADPAALTRHITDARFAKHLRNHVAFLEVGLLGLEIVDEPLEASRLLCRLAASFCDADVIGIAVPDRNLLAPNDPRIRAALCAEDPFDWPSLEIDADARQLASDDRGFDRAAAEARRRWPEFAAAFEASSGGDAFSVKVGVYEGEVCENLWFWLRAIDGDAIECVLESEPIYLTGVRRGDVRRFGLDAVLDWVRTSASGGTFGGFTLAR